MGSCQYVNVCKLLLAFKAVALFYKLSFSKGAVVQHSSNLHTWYL